MARPLGTFGDPVVRARAWHWLRAVQTRAGVETARQLDGHFSLKLDLGAKKHYFDQIRQDGFDPAGIEVGPKKSLLDFVSGKRRYKSAREEYGHPLWLHLLKRSPDWPSREAWLSLQLEQHSIVRITPSDERNGIELGLLPDVEIDPDHLPPLVLRAEKFASLDGLLLLLLLLREAQDENRKKRIERLEDGLRRAAWQFSWRNQYEGEILDTWMVLIESRMVAWRPSIEPSPAQLKDAEEFWREESSKPRSQGRRPADPAGLSKGSRSERRWRRRVWIRACRIHLNGVPSLPEFEYATASPACQWLIANQDQIHQHMSRAMWILVVGEEEAEASNLEPLSMPEDLYVSRKRKSSSETEIRIYGNQLFFDVIPVVLSPRKSG